MKRSIKKLNVTKATASLADYVQRLRGIPLVVTVKGRPVAALVPVEGLDWEGLSLGTNPQFLDLIEQSRRKAEKEGYISHEEVCRMFGVTPTGNPNAKANGPNSKRRSRKSKAPKRTGVES
jgi:prevent-host-death family protein